MATTFHLFTSLPFELRLKIYLQTFPVAQTLPVRFSRLHNQYTTTTPPHPLLHVSRECRTCYLSTHTNLILNPRYTSTIFVNFRLDTIFFDTSDCSPNGDLAWDLGASPHRDLIERCAIDAELWEVLRVFRFEGLSEVKMLGGVKVIALVLKRGRGEEARMAEEHGGNTVQSEIAMANGFVEALRAEIMAGTVENWEKRGNRPNVQLWLV